METVDTPPGVGIDVEQYLLWLKFREQALLLVLKEIEVLLSQVRRQVQTLSSTQLSPQKRTDIPIRNSVPEARGMKAERVMVQNPETMTWGYE